VQPLNGKNPTRQSHETPALSAICNSGGFDSPSVCRGSVLEEKTTAGGSLTWPETCVWSFRRPDWKRHCQHSRSPWGWTRSVCGFGANRRCQRITFRIRPHSWSNFERGMQRGRHRTMPGQCPRTRLRDACSGRVL